MEGVETQQVQEAPPQRRISATRKVVAFFVVLGLLCALFVVGLEMCFRLFVPVTDVAYMFWDPALGLRRIPDQSGRYILGNHINASYNFNAQGWNHPRDYVVSKPTGTRRICIVGDSQVESLQVDTDDAMYMVAERKMNRPDRPVEWYAFGCSGWGTAQEYECIRRYVLDYKPDVVFILFLQNDPFDCSPYIAAMEPFTPVYSFDEHDELTYRYPKHFERSGLRRSVSRFALVRYFWLQKRLVEKLGAIFTGKTVEGVGQLPLREGIAAIRDASLPGLSNMSVEDRQKRTWELIEKLLEQARDDCSSRGATLAVAFRGWTPDILARKQDKTLEVPEKSKDPYCLDERISEMGREWVGPICARLEIPYIDLTDALVAAEKATGQLHNFPDDNHYGPVGHAAAGEALAELAERILAEKPRKSEEHTR